MISPDRRRVQAFVSLGSNILPYRNLARAVELLVARLEITAVSSFWASEAKGAPGSPPFLNAAVGMETTLGPAELKFEVLRPLEAEMGRVRSGDRNAPRAIDLDLVLYGDLVVDQENLCLPDPELLTCAHIVVPLAEIATTLRHPVTGESIAALADALSKDAVIEVATPPPAL